MGTSLRRGARTSWVAKDRGDAERVVQRAAAVYATHLPVTRGSLATATVNTAAVRRARRPTMNLQISGRSLLESNAVTPATMRAYLTAVEGFDRYFRGAAPTTDVSDQLLEFFDHLFAEWARLRANRSKEAALFGDLTQERFAKLVKSSHEKVGASPLHATAYSLRHGGPSWDVMMKYRCLDEVQKRGRWRVSASVARYQKSAKLLQAMKKLSPSARRHAEHVSGSLEKRLEQQNVEFLSGCRPTPCGEKAVSSLSSSRAALVSHEHRSAEGLGRSRPTCSAPLPLMWDRLLS